MLADPGETPFHVQAPGGTIAGLRGGVGDPILLLHGGPGLSEYLGELAAELRQVGLATFRFQQRGILPSTVEGPFTVDRHVADAIAVLDFSGVQRAWVVGHSWGGYLALQLASRYPERFMGVLAIGTLGGVGDGGASSLGPNLLARLDDAGRAEVVAIEQREEAGTASYADQVRGLEVVWPAYFADPSSAPPLPADIVLSAACYEETVASIEPDAERLERSLATCPVPTVFLHGKVDPLELEASARATAAVMPRAEVIELEGVGHFAWLERPGTAADALVTLVALASGRARRSSHRPP
jgi:pimeloyl-ACP methyl ester carboxylesterase